MTDQTIFSKRNAAFVAGGVAASLALSFLVNYLLMLSSWLTPFGSMIVSALVVPICISVPLLAIVVAQRAEIGKRQLELNHFASHDRLTNFYRPGAFSTVVERRTKTIDNVNPSGAFLIVHADHLREINRSFGLEAGDEALALIAMAIRSSVRASDIVGRIGATMFGLFLPGATEAEARDVAERVVKSVRGVYFAPASASDAVSVRVGGIVFADEIGFGDMFRQAEERLFGEGDEAQPDFSIALGAVQMGTAAHH
ncbi:MAG: GGDEF domain-containing protein [Oricola sp.]